MLRLFFNNTAFPCSPHLRGSKNVGCCYGNYFELNPNSDATKLLIEEREKKYGVPNFRKNSMHRCAYHTNDGCVLKTHKSPICLAYICRSRKESIKKTFNVDYNCEPARQLLDSVLMGRLSQKEIRTFKLKIEEMVRATSK
jgi:hypothetical protein